MRVTRPVVDDGLIAAKFDFAVYRNLREKGADMLSRFIVDKRLLTVVLIKGKLNRSEFWVLGVIFWLIAYDSWQSLEDGGQDARGHPAVHQVELAEVLLVLEPICNSCSLDHLYVKSSNLHAHDVPLRASGEYLLYNVICICLYVAIYANQPEGELFKRTHPGCLGDLRFDQVSHFEERVRDLIHCLRIEL